jgi:hypothetical protein
MNSSFIKSSSRASKEKEKNERTKWVSGEFIRQNTATDTPTRVLGERGRAAMAS